MNKKLYVGNLNFKTTQEQLGALFAPYGEIVEATLIVNKFTGRSKGFGFVTLADENMADKAIAELNGKEVDGRTVKVSVAQPMVPRDRPSRRFSEVRNRGFRENNY